MGLLPFVLFVTLGWCVEMLNSSFFFSILLLLCSINPTLLIYKLSFPLLLLFELSCSSILRNDFYFLLIPIVFSLASVLLGGSFLYFFRLLIVAAMALLLVRLNFLHKILLYSSRLLFFLVLLESVLNFLHLPLFYRFFNVPLATWPYRPIFLFLEPNNFSIYASSLLILGLYFSFLISSSKLSHMPNCPAKFRLPSLASIISSEYIVLPSLSLLLIRSTYGLFVLIFFYVLLILSSLTVFMLRSNFKVNSYVLIFTILSFSSLLYFYLHPNSYLVGKILAELLDGSLRLESIHQGLAIVQEYFPLGVGSPNSKYIVYSNSSLIQQLYPLQSSHLILFDGLKQLAEYGVVYFLIYLAPVIALFRCKSRLQFFGGFLLFLGFLLLQLSPSSSYTLTFWMIYFLVAFPRLSNPLISSTSCSQLY